MNDTLTVGLVQRVGDLDAMSQRLLHREWTLLQAVRERLPLQLFHDQEVDVALVPDVVQHADVRVVEGGNRPRLALEALAQGGVVGDVRRQDLDGHAAIQPRVACAIDFAHPPGGEQSQDLVGTESRAGRQRHGDALSVRERAAGIQSSALT
jgi:hypothetical protein